MEQSSDIFQLSDDSDCEYKQKQHRPKRNNALFLIGSRNRVSRTSTRKDEDVNVETTPSNTGHSESILNTDMKHYENVGLRIGVLQNQRISCRTVIVKFLRSSFVCHFRRDTVMPLLMLSSVIMIMMHHMGAIDSNLKSNNTQLSWNGFDNLADLYTPMKDTDVPIFWKIPGSVTNVFMEDIFTECFNAKSKNSLSLGLETVR